MNILSRFKRSAFVFPLAVLAALALMIISETAYRRSDESLQQLEVMAQTRNSLQTLLRRMSDAETGQRGYLLTGRRDYLEPYQAAAADIQQSLLALQRYYANDPAHAASMKELDAIVHRKLGELATTLSLYEQGKEESWRTLLLSDLGKEDMQAMRLLAERLLADETAKVTAGRQDVTATLLLSRIGVATMTAISLLALAMYLRQTAALEQQRRAQADAIQAERDVLEVEVARRTSELTELAQHLQTAREDERSRLARELHDELGALLTAAKLDAARIKSRLGTLVPDANERLIHLNDTLNQGIALKRRIIEDLRPSSLSNLGLVAALEIQAREFTERTGVKVASRLDIVQLAPAVELTVYRLVQEAFTNIAKYAKATQVELVLADRGAQAEISVRDDGIGFELASTSGTAHGLVGMRYRVNAEGGQLRLETSPGKGTRIVAVLPIQPEEVPSPEQAMDASTAPTTAHPPRVSAARTDSGPQARTSAP